MSGSINSVINGGGLDGSIDWLDNPQLSNNTAVVSGLHMRRLGISTRIASPKQTKTEFFTIKNETLRLETDVSQT